MSVLSYVRIKGLQYSIERSLWGHWHVTPVLRVLVSTEATSARACNRMTRTSSFSRDASKHRLVVLEFRCPKPSSGDVSDTSRRYSSDSLPIDEDDCEEQRMQAGVILSIRSMVHISVGNDRRIFHWPIKISPYTVEFFRCCGVWPQKKSMRHTGAWEDLPK
jgi:hypothetical protein